jgi:hypothetical protein
MRLVLAVLVAVLVGCSSAPSAAYQAGVAARGTNCDIAVRLYGGTPPPKYSPDYERWGRIVEDFNRGCSPQDA